MVTWQLSATPANVASVVVFAVGMALAGTLLPLALVHRWGQVWPGWVLPLAGSLALGVAAVSYFERTRPACQRCAIRHWASP